MKKWAVGYISFFDNEMSIEIVEADSWHAALSQHSKMTDHLDAVDFTTKETAKQTMFDQDSMVDVVEIA